jgi:DNA polymerase-3 subunit gamma/tau
LLLDETQSSLFNEQYHAVISSALTQYFQQPLKVEIRTGAATTESPAARRQRIKREQRQAAIDNFCNDPNVREILERFSATIHTESLTLLNEE